jgi:hypothetical protein
MRPSFGGTGLADQTIITATITASNSSPTTISADAEKLHSLMTRLLN